MRSFPERERCNPRPTRWFPRRMERGQHRRGSTDYTAATARQPTGRHEEHRACPLRSTRIPNRTGKTYRSGHTAETPQRDIHAAAGPPVVEVAAAASGRTLRSRRTLIPLRILTADLAKQGGESTVEVSRQVVRDGCGRIRPHDHQRPGRQRRDPLPGEMPQLPLHSITDDRISDSL